MLDLSIKIKIEGFEDTLKDIEKAGGSIDRACEAAIKQSADIMETELKTEMQKSDVVEHLIDDMPAPEIEKEGNRFSARIGYVKDAYNPQKPSNAYKVIFLNYGTPRRKKHGKVKPRGFIDRAQKSAKPKIKKAQKAAFDEILARLKK